VGGGEKVGKHLGKKGGENIKENETIESTFCEP